MFLRTRKLWRTVPKPKINSGQAETKNKNQQNTVLSLSI